jgi:hypothetical protein
MINYDVLPKILLNNGFKEAKDRYKELSIKMAFLYGYKYEIVIDPPYIRLMQGPHKKGEWIQKVGIDELIGIFVYLKMDENQKEKINVVNIASWYNDVIMKNSINPEYIKGLEPFEKKIIKLFETFELK